MHVLSILKSMPKAKYGLSLIFLKTDALGSLVLTHGAIQGKSKRCMQAGKNQEQMAVQAAVSLLVPGKFSSLADPSSI